jgi:hypothetical protein
MQHRCASSYGASVSGREVWDEETNLSLSRGLGRLRLVEREVQVRAIVPGMRGMSPGKPAVADHLAAARHFVVSSFVKINAEPISIEGR